MQYDDRDFAACKKPVLQAALLTRYLQDPSVSLNANGALNTLERHLDPSVNYDSTGDRSTLHILYILMKLFISQWTRLWFNLDLTI